MDKTPRQKLATWMRKEMDGADEIDMPTLANRAVVHFSGDEEFLREWAADTLRPVAYTIGTQIASETRTQVVVHEGVVTEIPTEDRKRTLWLDRLEHVGDRYMRLRAMRRDDVAQWVEERRQRGTVEFHLAGIGEKMLAKLVGEQTVGEVFSDEEIQRWADLLRVQVKVNIPVPKQLRTTSEEAAD